jgi:hypothetical protein
LAAVLAVWIIVAACSPPSGIVELSGVRLTRPVSVTDVDTHLNERVIAFVLEDSEESETLVSLVRSDKPVLRGMEAFSELDLPCGAVVVGSLGAATPPGRVLGPRDVGRDVIRGILEAHLDGRLAKGEPDGRDYSERKHVQTVRDALRVLEEGCEPSN